MKPINPKGRGTIQERLSIKNVNKVFRLKVWLKRPDPLLRGGIGPEIKNKVDEILI